MTRSNPATLDHLEHPTTPPTRDLTNTRHQEARPRIDTQHPDLTIIKWGEEDTTDEEIEEAEVAEATEVVEEVETADHTATMGPATATILLRIHRHSYQYN